jgi:hypothetical protein
MQEGDETIQLELSDEWPPELARVVGLISIAFAQLQRGVFLAAKRKANVPLAQWEQQNRSDNFRKWCDSLLAEYPGDKILVDLIHRIKCAGLSRHDLIHASWGRHPDGHLGRWRRKIDLGIELGPLQDLLNTIRDLRDKLNRHTKGRELT